ncbi:MAG: ribosomal protein S18-alanine N-acetyltransferase [Pseudoflavonifractor capillosus]|uniref:ribosomal protein S18-alanine N-acetyltransferase n=1 Tax=Pseudoflavonifractor capillosus TaxID=106588 RepID=UPI0023F9CEF7|nr:ribosomal protein S18-alanine N-acetyltransferase [Pseudoflavonifractor capillosus]MCI5928654.1 ribosomal protein S18-alanine N-acetyltransferase [Pseudoflavonifractor capillosus]MDY4659923.1 ribosomal protein S18-alanine N-acetyltransferase [Pseudoflavonifractor capillosus]
MDFRLLPMDRSTVPDVAAIERECFSQPWSEDMLAEELYNDNASFIVAVADDGTVLGYAGLTVVLDEGYINNVAVRSQYRRMGVADALLGTFINFAEDHLAFLTLEVRASNDKAISLYTKNGFVQEGRRKDYYKDPKEDAIIMTRRFSGEEA